MHEEGVISVQKALQSCSDQAERLYFASISPGYVIPYGLDCLVYFQGPPWYLWKHSLDMEAVRTKEKFGAEKREAYFKHYFLFRINEPSLLFKSWIFQKIISKHVTRAVGQGCLFSAVYFKKKYLKYFWCCSVFTCTNLDLELEH